MGQIKTSNMNIARMQLVWSERPSQCACHRAQTHRTAVEGLSVRGFPRLRFACRRTQRRRRAVGKGVRLRPGGQGGLTGGLRDLRRSAGHASGITGEMVTRFRREGYGEGTGWLRERRVSESCTTAATGGMNTIIRHHQFHHHNPTRSMDDLERFERKRNGRFALAPWGRGPRARGGGVAEWARDYSGQVHREKVIRGCER